MKKFLSLVLVFVMLFCVTVNADELKLQDKMFENYNGTLEFSATLNKPLEILEFLKDTPIGNYLDVKAMCESLFDSNCTGTFKVMTSEKMKKGTIAMELNSKANVDFNQNLNVNINGKTGYWLNYDFTDNDNPQMYMIYSTPYSTKYIVFDNDSMDNLGNGMSLSYLNYDKIMEISDALEGYIEDNATVKQTASKITINISDKQFKDIIINICEEYGKDYINEIMKATNSDEISDEDFNEGIKTLKDTFDKVNILGEKGINIEYSLNSNKKIIAEKSSINVCLDLYDILTAYEQDTNGITKENGVIDFAFNISATYKNMSTLGKIEFPVLTNENSISYEDFFTNLTGTSYNDEGTTEYYDFYSENYQTIGKTNTYVKLRDVCDQFYGSDFNITYDNGIVSIDDLNRKYFDSVSLKTNQNEIFKNDEILWADAPVKEIDDCVYIDISAIKQIFGVELTYGSYDIQGGGVSLGFIKENN